MPKKRRSKEAPGLSIQKARTDLNIMVDLIPRENSNRPGTPLRASKITIHNTDNDEPGADARAHCRYQKGADAQARQVSWHFTVDDQSIYQSLPVDEGGWHAGTHEGNAASIGIEICENKGIDQEAANDRAARLTALLLRELGLKPAGNILQHHDWSGKNCPALLRDPVSGWKKFLQNVVDHYAAIREDEHENEHAGDVPSLVIPTASLDSILRIAASSDLARYQWRDRGTAPIGYIKGMAAAFGRAYCKFKSGNPAAQEMAKAEAGDGSDALNHYRDLFAAAGMSNNKSGIDTLRHLFVLMTGLGMRESSGKHCEGRDQSANNVTAETAEAGMFQTSYDLRRASPLLPQLFQEYSSNPGSGFLEIFKEGVHCHDSDAENFGTGPGRDFQSLCKQCPAFAAEFAAVGLRHRYNHWGPIIARKAELRPACDQMFLQVQEEIDNSKLCPSLLA